MILNDNECCRKDFSGIGAVVQYIQSFAEKCKVLSEMILKGTQAEVAQ